MKNKMSTKIPLADLVKEKRDAAEQRKLARESARKQKEQEERARQAALKREARKAALESAKRQAERERVEREQILRKKRLLSHALDGFLASALEGLKQSLVNTSELEVRPDLEQLGFEFFEQIESTYDHDALAKELNKISRQLQKVAQQLSHADDRLEQYLEDDAIRSVNVKTTNGRPVDQPIYSFEDALNVLYAFIHRQEVLRQKIVHWQRLSNLTARAIRDSYPEFERFSEQDIRNEIVDQKQSWLDCLAEYEYWLEHHPNLYEELCDFYLDVTKLLSIQAKLHDKEEELTSKLESNETKVFTYVSWRKRPSSRTRKSKQYQEIFWLSSEPAQQLFKRMSEYLVRHAKKSQASFVLSGVPHSSDEKKIRIGRESFIVPSAVRVKAIVAKITTWGFKVKQEKGQRSDHHWISVYW